jgi:1,4-dihydroxy-2-naphthoate polyprenyltransferase
LKNAIIHLRLPFSFFLLPVYIFALSQSASINWTYAVNVFISLHFFIYPASNAYNSFMDQDNGSIGLLKNPPPAERELYYLSLVMDFIGISLLYFISLKMVFIAVFYSGVSRAYSWTGIRLKKYPVAGWLTVILFQGAYTFMLVSMAVENNISFEWFNLQKYESMLLSTFLIGAYYPLSQIYQHDEDRLRGDITISLKLGIRGTFIFSASMFMVSFGMMFYYLDTFYTIKQFYLFMIFLLPAIVYFLNWMIRTFKKQQSADYEHAMRMTLISSTCLIIVFSIFLFINRQ